MGFENFFNEIQMCSLLNTGTKTVQTSNNEKIINMHGLGLAPEILD